MKTLIIALISLIAAVTLAQAAPTKIWSQGDPSAEEQYALEIVNAYRRDPVATIKRYTDLRYKDSKVAAILRGSSPSDTLDAEAKDLLDYVALMLSEGKAQLTTVPGRPGLACGFSQAPFAMYPMFNSRALYYRDNWGYTSDANDIVNFNTSKYNASTYILPAPFNTLFPAEPAYSGANATGGTSTFYQTTMDNSYRGTAIQYYMYDADTIGPRECFMNPIAVNIWTAGSTFFNSNNAWGHSRMIGINASKRVSTYKNGAKIMTIYFADNEDLKVSDLPFGADTAFVTGVIYKDLNGNGEYDPGEGIGGLTVTPSSGDFYAVTSTSGGYSIPVKTGSGSITLSVGGFTSQTVSVGSDNVKVDFVKPADKLAQIPVAGPDGSVQIMALSTRGLAKKDADALMGGVIISGNDGTTKKVVIRVKGASLGNSGLYQPLNYPRLKIYSNGNLLTSVVPSDCWDKTTQDYKATLKNAFTAVGLDQFDPKLYNQLWNPAVNRYYASEGAGDVAVIMDLAPGGYSCVAEPSEKDVAYKVDSMVGGVALIEVYDMEPAKGRLTAISTRGRIDAQNPTYGSSEAQMIVGVVTSGSGHSRLIFRGGGPALTNLNVPDVLDDTTITLYNAVTRDQLDYNDDWCKTTFTDQLRTLVAAVGLPTYSEGSLDSALLENLPSGIYSAVISPHGAKSSGVAMVEIYETPAE